MSSPEQTAGDRIASAHGLRGRHKESFLPSYKQESSLMVTAQLQNAQHYAKDAHANIGSHMHAWAHAESGSAKECRRAHSSSRYKQQGNALGQ